MFQKVQQSGQLTVSNDNGTFGRHVIEKLLLLSHRLRTAGMYYALKDCQVIENRRTILAHWTIVNCMPRVFQTPDEVRWGCGMIIDALRNKQIQQQSVIAGDIAQATLRTMGGLCLCVKAKLSLAVMFKSQIEGCPHPCEEKMQLIRKT